jgi:hypothetical protein
VRRGGVAACCTCGDASAGFCFCFGDDLVDWCSDIGFGFCEQQDEHEYDSEHEHEREHEHEHEREHEHEHDGAVA